MNKIIGYSDDELLVKILSFLPTKVAVSTSILSKHWKFLWMRATKLEFDDRINDLYILAWARQRMLPNSYRLKSERLRRFIAVNMPLHRAPVIESLRLKFLNGFFKPEDIKSWVAIAVCRCVRELRIDCFNALLPSSLYTCKSLVTLKLENKIIVDVPRVVCLPSLKTLHLDRVNYADKESLQRLLSNCPVLEDLIVELFEEDSVRKFAVSIPSLLSFTIFGSCTCDGYEIDTPSLKYFKARAFSISSSVLIANMPKLENADLALGGFADIKKLLKYVTSVRCLSLYSINNNAKAVYDDDIVFHDLEQLKFHIRFNTTWSKSLLWFLKSSPKLRDLEFDGNQSGWDTSVCWKRRIDAPQCLLSSLQTFNWTTCNNPSREDIDMAKYILRKSCRLRTATFLIERNLDPQEKRGIKNELLVSPRGSTTCNLVFE